MIQSKPGAQENDSKTGQREATATKGAPVRGKLVARVTIIEFSDFQCPFCARAVPTLQELVRQYPNEVNWVFKNYPLDFHPDSMLAHRAALAAGEQGRFWEMHDLIFSSQGALKRDDLISKARQLGHDLPRVIDDLGSNRFAGLLNDDKAEAARLGVTGTPTFFVNGKQLVGAQPFAEFKKAVEAELVRGEGSATVAASRETKLHAVAQNAGNLPLAAPDLIVTATGPENASVIITWYADLESPLSAQAAQIIREMMAAYPTKVRTVFKNTPMAFHAHALLAHHAVLAASAEGKFSPMTDLILARPEAITREILIGYAKQLSLNDEKFIARLDGHVYQGAVEADLAEAKRHGVFGVPAFFVNGRRIDGVQPLAVFKSAVDAELARVEAARTRP